MFEKDIPVLVICIIVLLSNARTEYITRKRRNFENRKLVELGKRYTYERELRMIADRKTAQLRADKKVLAELLDEKLKVVYSDGTMQVHEMVKFIAVKEGK